MSAKPNWLLFSLWNKNSLGFRPKRQHFKQPGPLTCKPLNLHCQLSVLVTPSSCLDLVSQRREKEGLFLAGMAVILGSLFKVIYWTFK